MDNETRNLYYKSEFKAIGDITRNDRLNLDEFCRLMLLLGYPSSREGLEGLWRAHGKEDRELMTLEEYTDLMFRPSMHEKTSIWRRIFSEFDTDGSGHCTKGEVIQGLENIGLDVTPGMRAKIEGMDADKDNKIAYEDFLKIQLKLIT